MKIKPSQNGDIPLSFTDVGKSCPSHKILTWQMSFKAIRKNKIITKIFEFTVFLAVCSYRKYCQSLRGLYTQYLDKDDGSGQNICLYSF